jgi:hypothetical protein
MNDIEGCRYPGLNCDRVCMECRGSFDVVDRETGRIVGDVDDTTAMNRMLREFGEWWNEGDEPVEGQHEPKAP